MHFGWCLPAHPQHLTTGSWHRGVGLMLKSQYHTPVFPGFGAQGAPLCLELSPEWRRPALPQDWHAGPGKNGCPPILPCKWKENRKRDAKTCTCNRSWALLDWRGSSGDGRAMRRAPSDAKHQGSVLSCSSPQKHKYIAKQRHQNPATFKAIQGRR